MSTVATASVNRRLAKPSRSGRAARMLTSWPALLFTLAVAALWSIPTIGLFITSIRPQQSITETGWWTWFTNPEFTTDNYSKTLFGGSAQLSSYFINSAVIVIPAVIIPVALASLAAYAFAWMKFRGRDGLFIMVFALQIVPIQVTILPLLTFFTQQLHINQTFWPVWIAHTIFGLPFAIYLLHNFMREIPTELIEAARVDGCGHVKIFFRVMLPLIVPALAAFCVFQFLWVWNDLLVALVFGSSQEVAPLTVRMAELSGSFGSRWHLLSAGAFISIIVPLIVFVALQRFFVRGLLAGSVKG